MARLLEQREREYRLMQEAARQYAQAKLAEIAESDEKRLAAADAAKERGEMGLAATLYLRLAAARRDSDAVRQAKQRFIDLRSEADQAVSKVDLLLETRNRESASGGASQQDTYTAWIVKAFDQYRDLSRQYGPVPGIGSKIRAHVARQRRTPEFAAVLEEPEARELWTAGRQYEAKGQQCCAFLAYEEAAKLKHAPSASFAAERLAALRRDPAVVAAAEACQELQWCHKTYGLAEKMNPAQARDLYRQIARRAPADSPIHQAALAKLQ